MEGHAKAGAKGRTGMSRMSGVQGKANKATGFVETVGDAQTEMDVPGDRLPLWYSSLRQLQHDYGGGRPSDEDGPLHPLCHHTDCTRLCPAFEDTRVQTPRDSRGVGVR